jgi:hypothetical protein
MPQGWWDIPTSRMVGRNDESYAEFERMYCHIWHFELQALVHLPFMLQTATDRRYEYSRLSCLRASRNLILRWMFIRSAYGKTLFSNLIEFQAFTSAITLLLGLLGCTNATTDPVAFKEREEDLQFVETVAQIFEGMKQYGGGVHVVNQSISVIRTLQGILREEENSSGSLCLAIPHFGTISIARGGAMQSLEGERILGANPRSKASSLPVHQQLQSSRSNSTHSPAASGQAWLPISASKEQQYQNMDGVAGSMDGSTAWPNNTVLQFTSTQFPPFDAQTTDSTTGWPFLESDMMYFDSLLNTDVAGSWNL